MKKRNDPALCKPSKRLEPSYLSLSLSLESKLQGNFVVQPDKKSSTEQILKIIVRGLLLIAADTTNNTISTTTDIYYITMTDSPSSVFFSSTSTQVPSLATTTATDLSSFRSITTDHESSSWRRDQQLGRRILKAQRDYLECVEALSATKVSDEKVFSPPATPNGHICRRSVSFATKSRAYCYDISPPYDLQDFWYNDEDEDRFKEQIRKEVDTFKLLKAQGENSTQHPSLCIVGLEQHLISPEHTKKRTKSKKLLKYAVLGAQAQCVGAERIAELSRRYSQWSASQARMFGDFQHIMSKK